MSRYTYLAHFGTITPEQAQVLGETFERIAQETELTPDAIVAEAESPGSPIHAFFDWDDASAAHSWRKTQAYYYLRNLDIEVVRNGEPQIVKAFHGLKVTKDDVMRRQFEWLDEALRTPEWGIQVIERAQQALVGWKQRYEVYAELGEYFAQAVGSTIQTAIEELDAAKHELQAVV